MFLYLNFNYCLHHFTFSPSFVINKIFDLNMRWLFNILLSKNQNDIVQQEKNKNIFVLINFKNAIHIYTNR